MNKDRDIYDLIIIGGGASSSFLCLSIFKIDPNFKILIIEKSVNFPQKIGESVVDLTALYVKSLGIQSLLDKHAQKTGVRFLFNESNSSDLSNVAEFASPTFPGLIKGYHLNRKIFDQDLLEEVIRKGAVVLRPAEIMQDFYSDFNNELDIKVGNAMKFVKSRWLVDASGRSRYIANKLNWKDKVIDLHTGSIMAHFKNIAPAELWDTKKNEYWDNTSVGLRKYSTTHLMRKNSWWWIIRLDEENTSIGVVFDKNKIQFEDFEIYFLDQLKNDAQLSIMTKGAQIGQIKHIDNLAYVSEKLFSSGIALIGDSGAFIDPLISPGLELIGQQSIWLAEMLTKEKRCGKFNLKSWEKYSHSFFKAYSSRISIYKTAYNFIHSFDIFTAWLKQGNYVYFGGVVYPAVLFKKRLKIPLQFNYAERLGLKYFKNRFNKIDFNRSRQNRISIYKPNTIAYSGVRVPKNLLFLFIPIYLLFKSILAYVRLELKESKYIFRRSAR